MWGFWCPGNADSPRRGSEKPSHDGQRLEAEVRRAAESYDAMRIIGPNSLGIMSPHYSLNASFAGDLPQKGNVAFISQSGAFSTAVLDWAIQEDIGFSYFCLGWKHDGCRNRRFDRLLCDGQQD